jgi:hypothetical protein
VAAVKVELLTARMVASKVVTTAEGMVELRAVK